ncbi:MAG TPA: HD domain-containing protein, partial [Nitrosopumilaceae archaeon]|nr:HD domain-containing protein [Nitrosopumilaceae archaeon]
MKTETKILKPLESYWNWNKETLDRISNLKGCLQNRIHHAEGDVYVHSQLVAEQMSEAISKGKYFGKQPETLMLSALLHDIAKPDTTSMDDITKDWISPGHAKLGEKIVRELLHSQLPFSQREEVAALVRFHGLPIWCEEKEDPAMDLIKASLRCNIKQLSLLAECDFKG